MQVMTSESFSDDEDLYEGRFTTPLMDRDAREAQEEKEGEKSRKELMEGILEEDEKEWKEQRKKTVKERRAKEMEVFEKEELENMRTTELAKQVGVTLTMLEPIEGDDSDDANIAPIELNLPTQKKSGWFDEIDREIDLEEEQDVEPSVVDGKLVGGNGIKPKIAKKAGILVGSAGGWSLEVFPGDFVVHRKFGIGRFERTTLKPKATFTPDEKAAQTKRRQELIRRLNDNFGNDQDGNPLADDIREKRLSDLSAAFGTEADTDPISNPQISVLEIAYKDALVHVPVERAYRLSRYRAGDAAIKPRLSKVRGEAWKKAKGKVMVSTAELAQDVLALYATRETLNRIPFAVEHEGDERVKFDKTFPFVPTPDQLSCFEAVENDMVWRKRPMDRLVCGDVGFGKTEVALRALFRCVANNRQAALLAPTGVLSAQHFKNVCARMEPFGVKVGLLRGGMGKNTKAGRELREQIKNGDVNIIVGTHALLSNGIMYKDLGLLVVDEEQRFGVKQKERLKLICSGVDVLTLSATPIPRTLQMSLSGIRDTSTIRSPPPMRKPTISKVEEFSEVIVKEAIQTELKRGGQCYFVVPRISMLEDASALIMKLFPDVRLIQAHGRMAKHGAEENVALFAEGKADVLLATTVIENGVDIPMVNTIIIQNAQAFGMSTLYQLRGRVGRSDRQAFAYFLHKEEFMSEQGAARLQAMADLHQLGSGFDVANRDLEIRGAGSLLGTEQSGMAARVGFDLYMRMLKKSIRQLRRLDLPTVPRTNIILPYGEGSIEGKGAFAMPVGYVKDPEERLRQEGSARLAESTAKLVELTQLWKDEYGPLPPRLQGRLKKLHLHACTRQFGIDLVGIITSTTDTDGKNMKECVLRAPGLRSRHWARICAALPKQTPPKGLNAVFPARFSSSGTEEVIVGGSKVDWERIIAEDEEDNDDDWDSIDREEVDAMKIITSAMNVEEIDEVDMEKYPRFVIPDFGSVKKGARVGAILKLLLPVVKVVAKNQDEDKEKAKMAVDLRDKREQMKKKRKEQGEQERLKNGYFY